MAALLAASCAGDPGSADAVIEPDVSVGDSVGGMRVVAADLRQATGGDEWVGEVRFSGRVSVSGMRRPHPSDPELDAVCFFADSASSPRLPRLANDQRRAWFCFTNPGEAATMLPDTSSSAPPQNITIDDYHYYYSFTDVYNEARLVTRLPPRYQ